MQWLSDLTDFANPLAGRIYKLILNLESLNPALQKYVAEPSRLLERLSVSSETGAVLMHGIYLPQPEDTLTSLGYKRVGLLAEATPVKNEGSLVILAVRKFRLLDPDGGALDLMRLASKFLPSIQKRFLRGMCNARPQLFSLPDDTGESIAMNLDYFLRMAPAYTSMLGELRLLRVSVREGNRILFYIQTNVILKQLAEFFGPQYITLEQVDDRDSMGLLWEPM